MIPLYWYAFFSSVSHREYLALFVFLLAGATDVLDGWIARRFHLVTPIGILLDPLADKLMILTVLASFWVSGQISWVTACLLLLRDAAMIVLVTFFHLRGKKTVPATIWGKSTTVLYYIAFVANILGAWYAVDLLWATVILSFMTSFVYVVDFRRLNGLRILSFRLLPESDEEPAK